MGQYDFTYEIPDNFKEVLVRFIQQNSSAELASVLMQCNIDYEDMGFALYAGMTGEVWNKKALDITLEGTETNIEILRNKDIVLKGIIHRALRPNTTGYLVRKIYYFVSDDFELKLPQAQGESFDILSRDIKDSLSKGEPTLVLDRLHTYSTKYLREICAKHDIETANNKGEGYPLHSLVGSLAKYYEKESMFDSEFVPAALKMTISTFETFNNIRNTKSFAHDNVVLDKAEATYVITIVSATLSFIHEVEDQ